MITFKMSQPALETPWLMLQSPPLIPESYFSSLEPPVVLSGESLVLDSEASELFPPPKQCVISSCIKSSVGFSAHPVEVRKDLVLTHTPGKWGGGDMLQGQKRTPAALYSSLTSLDRAVPEQSPTQIFLPRSEIHVILPSQMHCLFGKP